MLQRKSSAANIIDLIITFWYSFQTKLSILTQKVQISCILLRDRSVPASRVTIVHQAARRYYFLFIPFKEVKKLFFFGKRTVLYPQKQELRKLQGMVGKARSAIDIWSIDDMHLESGKQESISILLPYSTQL